MSCISWIYFLTKWVAYPFSWRRQHLLLSSQHSGVVIIFLSPCKDTGMHKYVTQLNKHLCMNAAVFALISIILPDELSCKQIWSKKKVFAIAYSNRMRWFLTKHLFPTNSHHPVKIVCDNNNIAILLRPEKRQVLTFLTCKHMDHVWYWWHCAQKIMLDLFHLLQGCKPLLMLLGLSFDDTLCTCHCTELQL